MEHLISVIVPIYNTEKYLKKCIDSILNQSYKYIEVILIDDGSTDDSSAICDKYAVEDKRIVVVHKKNQGLVGARKTGISIARGDYVLFVDSDDWIDAGMIKALYDCAVKNEADVVVSAVTVVNNNVYTYKSNTIDPGIYYLDRLEQLKKRLFLMEDYFSFSILPYLWNKLWKKGLLQENVMRMDERITVGEDVAIGFPTIMQAQRIVITEKSFYYYRQNNLSMLNNRKNQKKEFENAKRLYDYMVKRFKQLGENDYERDLRHYYINQLMTRAYEMVNKIIDCKGCFPFVKELNRAVVIYGAGVFGASVYDYVRKHFTVKAWIDSNANQIKNDDYLITTLDDAYIDSEDLVFISIINDRVANEIHNNLLLRGIKDDNIKRFKITEQQENSLLEVGDTFV